MGTPLRICIAVAMVVIAASAVASPSSRTFADAQGTAAGVPTLRPLPMGTTAVCMDFTTLSAVDPSVGCADHGGTLDLFGTSAQPAAASPAQLDTALSAGVVVDAAPGTYAVQAPSGASGGYSSYAENPTGPLNVAAWLDDGSYFTCRGGPVTVNVQATDDNGNPVQGAAVSGYVQFDNGGSSLNFQQPTDSTGFASMKFNSGSPRGGYEVIFSLHVQQGGGGAPLNGFGPPAPGAVAQGGLSADTTTACWAP